MLVPGDSVPWDGLSSQFHVPSLVNKADSICMYMAEYEEILDITLILCACRLFTARCRFAFLFYSSSPPSAVNLPTDPRRPGAAICFVHMHSRLTVRIHPELRPPLWLFVQHGELSVTIVHFRISAPSWRYEYGVGVQPNRRFGKSERMQVPPDGYNTGLLNHMVWMYTNLSLRSPL